MTAVYNHQLRDGISLDQDQKWPWCNATSVSPTLLQPIRNPARNDICQRVRGLSVVTNNSGFNPGDYTKHLIDKCSYPGVIQPAASAGGPRVIGKLSQF